MKSIRSLWLIPALAVGLLVPAMDAHALTVQEIINMSQQGLSDDVLITVIQSSGSLPEMTTGDVENLKLHNISNRVIEKLMELSHPEPVSEPVPSADNQALQPASDAASSASAGEQKQPVSEAASSASAAEPVQPVPENVSVPVVVPVIGDQTILAPVESSNLSLIFKKYFEDAYETYTIQSEIARKYDELQNKTDTERAFDAELPKVQNWIKNIQNDPVRSMNECLNMIAEVSPSPDSPLGASLNQCIGLALDALHAPAMAARYLDRSLQAKATIVNYSQAFQTFLDDAHQAEYLTADASLLRQHENNIKDDVKQAFYYQIGYSLVYGQNPDIQTAISYLNKVHPGDIYYARSKILLATLAVRAPEYKFKTAAEHLNDAIQALKDIKGEDSYKLSNTSWMTLARIAFENHAYDVADSFYKNVDVNSHHFKDAMLEDGWSLLFSGHHAEALAITHALRAPNFEKAWLPDMLLIEAAAYLGLCRYDMAEKSINAFKEEVISDSSTLKSYIAEIPAKDYYTKIIQHAENSEESSLPDAVYNRVINDMKFRDLHTVIRTLTNERKMLNGLIGNTMRTWPAVKARYDQEIELYKQQMAQVLTDIYNSTLSQLHSLDISSSQITIEIRLAQRRREAECLKIVAAGGQCKQDSGNEENIFIQKREMDALWNFEGEFWRDELRTYVSGISSVCKQ